MRFHAIHRQESLMIASSIQSYFFCSDILPLPPEYRSVIIFNNKNSSKKYCFFRGTYVICEATTKKIYLRFCRKDSSSCKGPDRQCW